MKRSSLKEADVLKVEAALRGHVDEKLNEVASGAKLSISALTLTYGELVKRSEVGIPRGQKCYLDAVAEICRGNGEPSLDCLVVNAKSRKPGVGFRTDATSWEVQVRSCFGVPSRE